MSDTILRAIPKVGGLPLHRPYLVHAFTFIAILLVVSLFFVWSRLQVVNLEYNISSLESRVRDLSQDTKRLKLEAASLRNPVRIELAAKAELGLRLPTPEQIIIVQ